MKTMLLALTALVLVASPAIAHVSVVGPGFAGTNQEITFNIGHGCDGLDTFSLRIEIPAAVTALRTVSSTLGAPSIEYNAAELISAVTYTKADAEILEGDSAYYKIVLRMRIPNAPLTTLRFPAIQTCKSPSGETKTVAWTGLDANASEDGPEPAAALTIVPPRVAGWNRYTVPVAVADLSAFFADALIVWKGNAAYSANAITAGQIGSTEGVTVLAALAAGDEIWVRY